MHTTMPQPARPAASRRSLRQAFSLIELMIVIVIIAILMSLLLAGVRGAMTTARNATVTVEFLNIEKAVQDFKSKFGAEPPSGIVLYEASGWLVPPPASATPAEIAAAARSRALIRQIWPDFDFSLPRDINGDYDSADTITLNGAEALVFFLGGVSSTNVVDKNGGLIGVANAPVTTWAPLGFSANPENPLDRGGARLGPFFEIKINRLKNRDGLTDPEGMPEYLDPLPGQTNPILYASSYGGRGYRDADVQLTSQPAYNAYLTPATTPTGFAYVYRRYTGTVYPAPVTAFTALDALNPKTFQLISPGADGEYGWGGVLSQDSEMIETQPQRYFERDNITNFKGGTIN